MEADSHEGVRLHVGGADPDATGEEQVHERADVARLGEVAEQTVVVRDSGQLVICAVSMALHKHSTYACSRGGRGSCAGPCSRPRAT